MSSLSTTLITSVADFAARAHKNQRRKNASADPYINHPIEVAAFANDAAVNDGVDAKSLVTIIAGAYLHDVVEDCGITLKFIDTWFGPDVARVVEAVSDDKTLPKVMRKQLQIEHAETVSVDVGYVKLADKLSNTLSLIVSPPASWTPEIIRGYRYWSYAVVNTIYKAHPDKYDWFKSKFDWTEMNLSEEYVELELAAYYRNIEAAEYTETGFVNAVERVKTKSPITDFVCEYISHPLVVSLATMVFTSLVFRWRM